MSNPKPRSGRSSRGRSVSPSQRKTRSKSVHQRKEDKEENHDQKRKSSSRREKSGEGRRSKSRGRSKSVHARNRSRSKSVHQKSSRDKESGRDKGKERDREAKKERRSRSKSVHRKKQEKQQQQQYSDDDYSEAEEVQQPAPSSHRRASMARGASGRRNLSSQAADGPSGRMRRSKSMNMGSNHMEPQPDEQQQQRRARRRLSSFGNTAPAAAAGSGDETAKNNNNGRPTLSKELQKRRSVRRLQVEEIKTKERIQNAIFDQALSRSRSSRALNIDPDDDDDVMEAATPRRSGSGSRRSSLAHSGAAEEKSQRSSRTNRRASMDRGSSLKRSSSRRGLSIPSDEPDEPMRRSIRGGRRSSLDMGGAMKRASSTRRLMVDSDEDGNNNTRRKNRTTGGGLRRSNTMEIRRPSSNNLLMDEGSSSMKRSTSCEGMEEPIRRISRSNRRGSMDCALKRAVSSRRLSIAASKTTEPMEDNVEDDNSDYGSDLDESEGEDVEATSNHTAGLLAPPPKDSCAERSAHKRSICLSAKADEDFFGDFSSDDDFFKKGAGAKAGTIEDEAKETEADTAFEVLAKAENARRLPPRTNSTAMQRSSSRRRLIIPDDDNVEEEEGKEKKEVDDPSVTEEEEESMSEQEEDMTEITEDQSDPNFMDESESIVEVKQPSRRAPPRRNSKGAMLLQRGHSRRRSIRDLEDEEEEEDDLDQSYESETDEDTVVVTGRLPPKLDSKSAFLQKAAQGKALLEQAKSEKKYELGDSSIANDQQQSTTDSMPIRVRRRSSAIGAVPPSKDGVRSSGLYDKASRRSQRGRTSLGLIKLGKMDESHTTCQSQHTRSTVSTVSTTGTNSTISRSSASQLSRSSWSSSSAESNAQRMKDIAGRYRSSKSHQRRAPRPDNSCLAQE